MKQKISNLKQNRTIRMMGFFVLLLILWQIVYLFHFWPPYTFPSPSSVLMSFVKGVQSGTIWTAISHSMGRIIIGFLVAAMIGLVLGIATSNNKLLNDTVGQTVLGLQTLPSICWLPLAILWFGLNDTAIIFVTVAGAVCSITMAVNSGIRNVPPLYINAAKTMGASGLGLYLHVILPASLPTIISGMRQGWSFAWRSLMAGEMIFFTPGLGQLLQVSRDLNDISGVIGVMIVIMLLGLLIERFLFAALENRVRRKWGLHAI